MEMEFKLVHTEESYVVMELFNQDIAALLQHFVDNVSLDHYKKKQDKHIENATIAFYSLAEVYALNKQAELN